MDVLDRFLTYVSFGTNASETSGTHPSSESQLVLAKHLADEMRALGLTDVFTDEAGNTIGTLPGNCDAPAIALIAHIDTSPDAPGDNIRARVEHFDGSDIELSPGITLGLKQFPYLERCVGQELVVTDGTTLLGSDDKAGVAEIMSAAQRLLHSDRPHATLRIGFTPDEEIGRGADRFDVAEFAADYAYTVDGGTIGELEYENFNAASASVVFHGLNIHPGSAKDKMVNAQLLAMEFNAMLPVAQRPEYTDGYEGFIMLHGMEGEVESASLHYIIRDHDMVKFLQKKQVLTDAAAFLNAKYGVGTVGLTLHDSYFNMKEKILPKMFIVERAQRAMKNVGIEPKIVPIRGGTDGARLSFMGLPCPNLCTGGANFHGRFEYIPVEDMETITDMLVELLCNVE